MKYLATQADTSGHRSDKADDYPASGGTGCHPRTNDRQSPAARHLPQHVLFGRRNGEDRSPRRFSRVHGANEHLLVEHTGFEPVASSLPAKRSSQMS